MGLWGALAGLLVPLGLVGVGVAAGASLQADVVGAAILAIGDLGAATAAGTIKLVQASEKGLEAPDRNEVLPPSS
jgi:hypothetical protein